LRRIGRTFERNLNELARTEGVATPEQSEDSHEENADAAVIPT